MHICAQWACASAQTLFVGDSENDRLTAANAGAVFAALRNKDLSADIYVDSFAALAGIIWPDTSL